MINTYLMLQSTDQIDVDGIGNQKIEDDDNMDVEEMDDLLMEVQKELFTRFKNMFESDMLLPNLEFNPEF